MALYLVETVTMFRHYYVVDAKEADHAGDTVVCQDAEEFDQKYLDEVITTTREITTEEFNQMAETAMNGHLGEKIIYRVDYSDNERPNYSSNVEGIGI